MAIHFLFSFIAHFKTRIVYVFENYLLNYFKLKKTSASSCFLFKDFVITYCPNGDLLDYIKKCKQFDLKKTQFYTAELVTALEYMHSKKVVHRDLKPENILMDENYHIKLTDFGSGRILMPEPASSKELDDKKTVSTDQANGKPIRRRNSFVGTAQFVAPEILQGKEANLGSDLWGLGCIIFQMLTGKHLFSGK